MFGSLSWEIFDGGPADSASWVDWLNAVKKAVDKPNMSVDT